MRFVFEKERMTALSGEGTTMGYVTFPRIRAGLVNINHVMTIPEFRGQGVAEAMMDALLTHLAQENQKAALTCSFAQAYVGRHEKWKRILPEKMHFGTH